MALSSRTSRLRSAGALIEQTETLREHLDVKLTVRATNTTRQYTYVCYTVSHRQSTARTATNREKGIRILHVLEPDQWFRSQTTVFRQHTSCNLAVGM
jgi:hypothetical protein